MNHDWIMIHFTTTDHTSRSETYPTFLLTPGVSVTTTKDLKIINYNCVLLFKFSYKTIIFSEACLKQRTPTWERIMVKENLYVNI